MHSVNVNKDELLKIVRENRSKHDLAYKEAKEGYQEKLVKKLKELLKNAKAGKAVPQNIGLVQPVCNLDDYDKAIRMLELTTDDIIGLDSQTFEQLVLDKWHWKHQFEMTNALYSKSAAR